MTVKVFVLTPFIQKTLKGKGLIKSCRECGCSFKVSDVILSKQGGNRKKKWYCRKCALKFGLI